MATPSLTLQPNWVLIQQSASTLGIEMVGTPLIFGTIALIYATSDTFSIGDSVLFNPSQGSTLRYLDTDFYLIKEQYVYSKEVAV